MRTTILSFMTKMSQFRFTRAQESDNHKLINSHDEAPCLRKWHFAWHCAQILSGNLKLPNSLPLSSCGEIQGESYINLCSEPVPFKKPDSWHIAVLLVLGNGRFKTAWGLAIGSASATRRVLILFFFADYLSSFSTVAHETKSPDRMSPGVLTRLGCPILSSTHTTGWPCCGEEVVDLHCLVSPVLCWLFR